MRTSQADELGHSGPRDALAFATGTSTPVNERPTSSPAGNFSSRYAYWADDLDHPGPFAVDDTSGQEPSHCFPVRRFGNQSSTGQERCLPARRVEGAGRRGNRLVAGTSRKRLMGLEPTTFCMASSCRSAASACFIPVNRRFRLTESIAGMSEIRRVSTEFCHRIVTGARTGPMTSAFPCAGPLKAVVMRPRVGSTRRITSETAGAREPIGSGAVEHVWVATVHVDRGLVCGVGGASVGIRPR
jgi:hypothetical protein